MNAPGQAPLDRVVLTFDARCKSRLLVTLESGERAALVVERGRVLRGGDRVSIGADREVEVVAAAEALLEAESDDAWLIAKAAYHLGNRHVAVQVLPNRLRFLDDHVLAKMVEGLGLRVRPVTAPFEPEGGAYGRHHGHGSQEPLLRPKIHDFGAR